MISFDDFCSKQFLAGEEKQIFKDWLGEKAQDKKYKFEWLRLFNEFLRSKFGKVFA